MVGSYSCTRKSMIVQLLYIHTVKIHERELRPSRPPLHHKPQVTRVGAHRYSIQFIPYCIKQAWQWYTVSVRLQYL